MAPRDRSAAVQHIFDQVLPRGPLVRRRPLIGLRAIGDISPGSSRVAHLIIEGKEDPWGHNVCWEGVTAY